MIFGEIAPKLNSEPNVHRPSRMLTPYRVTPVHPLQNVWAGDDPANPVETISLVFPDQTTTDAVKGKTVGP
ncbi:MAG: hypothetical protein JWO72_1270 [Caulobacteraceae bacterium]|nr:hypothetical protein [Caulobacteraceae bacterium]